VTGGVGEDGAVLQVGDVKRAGVRGAVVAAADAGALALVLLAAPLALIENAWPRPERSARDDFALALGDEDEQWRPLSSFTDRLVRGASEAEQPLVAARS
jgi:hypothetical protein